MRVLLLSFFLLALSAQSYCQSIAGIYKHKSRQFDEEYFFGPDNSFEWYRRSGTGMISGDGTYSLNGDEVTLHFGTARPRYEVQVSQAQPNPEGKTNFRMSAIYTNGLPFTSLKATLENTGTSSSANEQGVIDLNLLDAPTHDMLKLEVNADVIYRQKIVLRGFNLLYALVFETQDQYKENTVETVTVVRKRKKLLITDATGTRKFRMDKISRTMANQS